MSHLYASPTRLTMVVKMNFLAFVPETGVTLMDVSAVEGEE
jgi:hypothetical protein